MEGREQELRRDEGLREGDGEWLGGETGKKMGAKNGNETIAIAIRNGRAER